MAGQAAIAAIRAALTISTGRTEARLIEGAAPAAGGVALLVTARSGATRAGVAAKAEAGVRAATEVQTVTGVRTEIVIGSRAELKVAGAAE